MCLLRKVSPCNYVVLILIILYYILSYCDVDSISFFMLSVFYAELCITNCTSSFLILNSQSNFNDLTINFLLLCHFNYSLFGNI